MVAAAFAPLAARSQSSSFLAFQGRVNPGVKAAEALAGALSFRKDTKFLRGVPLLAGLAEAVGTGGIERVLPDLKLATEFMSFGRTVSK